KNTPKEASMTELIDQRKECEAEASRVLGAVKSKDRIASTKKRLMELGKLHAEIRERQLALMRLPKGKATDREIENIKEVMSATFWNNSKRHYFRLAGDKELLRSLCSEFPLRECDEGCRMVTEAQLDSLDSSVGIFLRKEKKLPKSLEEMAI